MFSIVRFASLVFTLIAAVTMVKAQEVLDDDQPEINLILKGVIYNAEDSSRIAFAHVGIPNDGIGVVTNDDGQFELKLDTSLLTSDTVEFSLMGCSTKALTLAQISEMTKPLIIFLEPNSVLMHGITVTEKGYQGDSALYYVRKAISKLKDNYPLKVHQLQGFYRELVYEDNTFMNNIYFEENDQPYLERDSTFRQFSRLYEALVQVQDYGIKSVPSKMKIKVIQSRKSNDYEQLSDAHKGHNERGERNPLFQLFERNPIRNHYSMLRLDPKRAFFESRLEGEWNCDFWLHAKTTYNNEKVYHVKYRGVVFEGDIYINTVDFGIFKFTQYMSMSGLSFASTDEAGKVSTFKKKIDKKSDTQLTASYIKIDGTYYLSYVDNITGKNIVKSKVDGETRYSESRSLFIVNQVSLKDKQFEKVRAREAVDDEKDLYGQKAIFDSSFWNRYNVMLETPLERKVIEDLELEETLEEQFKKTGN